MPDPKEKNTQDASKTNSSILPITPDREKMSRALGAAFLQHKVQQLERNLDDLSFRRDIHPPDSRRSQSKKKILPTACPPSPPPIKLIDTSMLIHALPILKKWVRQAKFRIVIPLDVVSELDFLKTSPPPIHGLVREATCWLDKQFQNSSAAKTTPHNPCFIPQRTGDESGWEELSQRFVPPPIEVASIPFIKEPDVDASPTEAQDEEEPEIDYRALISADLPHEYRSLLQCALYHQLHTQPNQESELVIYLSDKDPSQNPAPKLALHHHYPHHHDNNQTPKASPGSSHWHWQNKLLQEEVHSAEEPVDKAVDLCDWAERFQIKTQKLHPADLSQAKQWIRSHNEKLKQQQQSQRRGPSSSSASTPSVPTRPANRSIHSDTHRPPSSAPRPPASSSSSAVDKRLFVW